MAKEYEITGEIDAVRRSTRTLSFLPKLTEAPEKCFKELIQGKVKVAIYDFTAGKGDHGIYAYFNLELADVKYLYERARDCYMTKPMQRQKIYGDTPNVNPGAFQGLCPSFKLTISREETILVKGQQQKTASPWQITIENGYGEALPGKIAGTFYEKSNTFQSKSKNSIRLTDEEFFDRIETVMAFIKEYRHLVAEKSLMKNLTKLEETLNRNNYNPDIAPETYNDNSGSQYPNDYGQPEAYAGGPEYPPQGGYYEEDTYPGPPEEAQKSDLPDGAYETTILITTPFQAVENGTLIANCMMNGREFLVYFFQPEAYLYEAQAKRYTLKANLVVDDRDRIWFHSLV